MKRKAGKRPTTKRTPKTRKATAVPRHQYVEVFKRIVPLFLSLAVLDIRDSDDGDDDMGVSVWQRIAEDLAQHLTPDERDAALGRADMLLGVMLATEGEA